MIFSYSLTAQLSDTIYHTQISIIDKKADSLKLELEKYDYNSELHKKNEINFTVDTFKIEQLLNFQVNKDYSTAGMINALKEAEIAYTILLGTQYELLINQLSDGDKVTLETSQQNWVISTESEVKMIYTMGAEEYSGGGTMQHVIISTDILNITKKRVLDIHYYLTRISVL